MAVLGPNPFSNERLMNFLSGISEGTSRNLTGLGSLFGMVDHPLAARAGDLSTALGSGMGTLSDFLEPEDYIEEGVFSQGQPMSRRLGEVFGEYGDALVDAPAAAKGLLSRGVPALGIKQARKKVYRLPDEIPEHLRPHALSEEKAVFHGVESGAHFGRFDPHFIGSGEGTAAYGKGIYTSEKPGVAGSYAADPTDWDGLTDWLAHDPDNLERLLKQAPPGAMDDAFDQMRAAYEAGEGPPLTDYYVVQELLGSGAIKIPWIPEEGPFTAVRRQVVPEGSVGLRWDERIPEEAWRQMEPERHHLMMKQREALGEFPNEPVFGPGGYLDQGDIDNARYAYDEAVREYRDKTLPPELRDYAGQVHWDQVDQDLFYRDPDEIRQRLLDAGIDYTQHYGNSFGREYGDRGYSNLVILNEDILNNPTRAYLPERGFPEDALADKPGPVTRRLRRQVAEDLDQPQLAGPWAQRLDPNRLPMIDPVGQDSLTRQGLLARIMARRIEEDQQNQEGFWGRGVLPTLADFMD